MKKSSRRRRRDQNLGDPSAGQRRRAGVQTRRHSTPPIVHLALYIIYMMD